MNPLGTTRSYENIIRYSVSRARRQGYRIQPNVFFDAQRMICCPIGAVYYAEKYDAIPFEFKVGYTKGFDNKQLAPYQQDDLFIQGFNSGKRARATYGRNIQN